MVYSPFSQPLKGVQSLPLNGVNHNQEIMYSPFLVPLNRVQSLCTTNKWCTVPFEKK